MTDTKIFENSPTSIPIHQHNGIDSNTLNIGDIIPVQSAITTVSTVSGTAGATYTSAEQTIINNHTTAINLQVAAINSIINKLKAAGITL